MTSSVERADERIRRFAARRPDAVRLARFASLAVRVDAPLLRALRVDLLPQADAGAEADLWFGPLNESVSSQGFVLESNVADRLRSSLAEDLVDGQQRDLDRAARIVAEAHKDWAPSLQAEERITWLALRKDGDHGEEIDGLLRQAAKAMASDETRGREVARWALRALPRLPEAARETETALLLALGASERLGGREVLSGADRAGALPIHAAWMLPPRSLEHRTRIGLKLYAGGVEFLAPEAARLTVELPATNPLYVELSWAAVGRRVEHTLSVTPGRRFALPTDASDIRLRTLAGEEFAIEESVQPVSTATDVSMGADLTAACVRICFRHDSRPDDVRWGVGYFVAPDLVMTSAEYVDPSANPESDGVGNRYDAFWTSERRVAETVAVGRSLGLALLRIEREFGNTVVLPRDDSPAAVPSLARWEGLLFDSDDGDLITRMAGSVVEPFKQGSGEAFGSRETFHVLTTHDSYALGTPGIGFSGAPVVVNGQIVGQIAHLRREPEAGRVALYAIPTATINQFVYDSFRPGEHDPYVFLSPLPSASDASPQGAALERVRGVLRQARLMPVPDSGSAPSDGELTDQIDASGGAIVFDPDSSPEAARRETLLLAYRKWAKADFPLVALRIRTRRPKPEDL